MNSNDEHKMPHVAMSDEGHLEILPLDSIKFTPS
jgi:hypothetical protein